MNHAFYKISISISILYFYYEIYLSIIIFRKITLIKVCFRDIRVDVIINHLKI